MNNPKLNISNVEEGNNSVLFQTPDTFVLYEKLANTIHSGDKTILKNLQQKVESIEYNPAYESQTLKKGKDEKVSGLVLNVTENCNFRCSYCINSGNYLNEQEINSSQMNFGVAKKGVDLFIPQSEDPALISFYGGEPLNNMGLIKKVVGYIRKNYPNKEVRFSMTSNFYNVDKYLETIVGNDIYIVMSLDGPKEIHDKNRIHQAGKPTWDKIISNLKKLEEYSPGYVKSHIGQSVTCADQNDLLKIADFFKNEIDYSIFRIGGVETKGLKKKLITKSTFSPTYELASEFLDCIEQEKQIPNVFRLLFEQKLKMISQRGREKMPEKLTLNGCCYPGKRKLFVDTDGQLYMCERFGKRKSIGDINRGVKQNLVDDVIEEFKQIRNNLCTDNCWAQRLCTPCIQSAKDPKGEISVNGLSQTCNSSKHKILTSLALYTKIIKRKKEFIEDYLSLQLNESEVKNGSKNR